MVTFARRWRLSDQRIHTKLTLILVLPLLAIVTLAGLSVRSTASVSASAEQARHLVALGSRAAELSGHLQFERVGAALVLTTGSGAGLVDDYRKRTDATDAAIERFRDQRRRGPLRGMSPSLLARIDGNFDKLRPVRLQVSSDRDAAASGVAAGYQVIIADLLELRESLPQVEATTKIAGRLRATASLGNAAEALGGLQTTVVRSLAAGRITPAAQREIVAADVGFARMIGEFRRLAPAAWISRLNLKVAGPEVYRAEQLHNTVVRAQPGPLSMRGVNATGWASAVQKRIRLLHALEAELDAELVAEIEQRRDEARRDVGMMATGAGLAVLAMIALGAVVARSLTRSLTGLSAAAEVIANARLPQMVAQVSAGGVDLDQTRRFVAEIVEPIPVLGRDEVGQVAAAFNAVTASAVRLAGEQAALRGGVRAIFNSLSRRSQRRLNTVMASIDSLQANQTDPDQLTLLFRLDHAATGLRRLTAGLQVLAGGRAGLIRPEPMVLSAVLRAAQSEIDQYQRIDIGVVDDRVQIHGEAVEEVIHLLAELLDNAARFSPPSTLVVINGRRMGDRVHIQITDAGKGMSEAQLEAARDRIAHPHRLDHHAAQQMGLPVVSAIADRLRIAVDLGSAQPHGTRVDLTLPPALFQTVSPGSTATGPDEVRMPEAGSLANFPTVELPTLAPALAAVLAPTPAADPPSAPAVLPPGPPLGVRPVQAAAEPARKPAEGPEPTPEIYQQLKHAWFGEARAARHWAGSDAEPAAAAEAAEFTTAGLPKRRRGGPSPSARDGGAGQPGWTPIPPGPGRSATERRPVGPGPGPAPAQHPAGGPAGAGISPIDQRRGRDSEQLRRRYAGLDRGLMTARRRSLPRPAEEEPDHEPHVTE